MNNHGGRNGESIMMEEALFSNGRTNGLKRNSGPNGETNGKTNFSRVSGPAKEKHGMYRLPVNVGQGHGVKNTSETARCTSMEKAQPEKVGILL